MLCEIQRSPEGQSQTVTGATCASLACTANRRAVGRAVSCGGGHWFIEAVETDAGARRRGYGRLLLLHATEYLSSLGARVLTCVIYQGNEASRRLHESCGFEATDEGPVDPWGGRDECGVLYRLAMGGDDSLA
ncbi:MAG: GNAT family N-acetyltransferase [Atopobiaceae bacterium]|nr:GNAT family N-acetyltransferase [Atopobiaceae bacterium]